jgi:hypothetical protein
MRKDKTESLLGNPFPGSSEGPPSTPYVGAVDHRCPEIASDSPHGAFVAGAKWWEWIQAGATMWASDRDLAWAEAERRYGPVPAPPESK